MTEQEAQERWDRLFLSLRKQFEAMGKPAGEAMILANAQMQREIGPRPGPDPVGECILFIAQLGILAGTIAAFPGGIALLSSAAKIARPQLASVSSQVVSDTMLALLKSAGKEITMDWLKSLWKSARVSLIALGGTIALALLDQASGFDLSVYIKAHWGAAAVFAPLLVPAFAGLIELIRNAVNTALGKYKPAVTTSGK
jgi:hypothetical protein